MKTKGKKTKRWQKHCSSVSNPSERRFREAAKNRFFKPSGPSALTVEALQQHDRDAGQAAMDLDPQQSDALTFNTWATNFTNCTNLTFGRVHKLWNSNSATHKEILALLATVTEVIQEKGGTGTDTEYFYALISYMEDINSDDKHSEDTATAAALLLSMAVKKVPASSLKSRFSDISKGLLGAIFKHAETESTSLLKSLLMTLACVLRVQEAAAWTILSTKNAYKILLDFVLHKKPRVRKAAQQAVKVVLKGSLFLSQPNPPPHHPAAVSTSDFCCSTIEKKGGKLGAAEAADTLHALDLLQDVMVTFPKKNIEKCCNTILSVMTVSKPLVIEHSMKALYGLFSQHPSATEVPAQLNAQIINALHSYRPEENDSLTMPVFLALMGQAHLNLSRLDMSLCLGHLPKLFAEAMKCLLSHHKSVRSSAANVANMLLRQCIGMETEQLAAQMKGVKADGAETPMHKIIHALETGLSYQFNQNWDMVFHLLATAMEVLGQICPDLLKKCLRSMADLRDSVSFGFRAEVDLAVGKAVRFMGPRQVMDAIPLSITGNEENPDLSRSWLLPVIRDNVSDTEFAFFFKFFLPLANRFHQTGKKFASEEKKVLSETYETLELQVWSMLKGFSTRPTDLAKSFDGNIAKELGKVLTQRQDLQMDVMAALRNLVNSSKNDEKDRATMSRFAKNYLPILFNIYTAECDNPRDSRRLAALETIKVYLSIADAECLSTYQKNCLKNLTKEEEQTTTTFKRIALTDIATALVSYGDEAYLNSMYTLAGKNIQASDKTLQKKGYSILKEIIASQSESCRQFMTAKFDQLQQLLLSSLATAAPSTKNPRLKCLTFICQHLTEPNTDFVQAVIPEAVQCTRGVGERARAAAYQLIVDIAEMMMRWNPDTKAEDVLSSYIDTMLAGLSGSPEMMSATLLALTRLMIHYKDRISGSTLTGVMNIACVLLQHEKKEVVRCALDFIKTIVGAYQQEVICTYLADLVSGLAAMKCKTALHVKTKFLLKKLMKKLGHEAVLKVSPQSLHKVVQKASHELKQEQKKKKKEQDKDSDKEDEEPTVKSKPETVEEILQDSDFEEEGEDKKRPSEKQGKKGGQRQAWIKEGDEDITDLMDTSAAKKVMASKPKTSEERAKARDRDKDHGFKIAPDGRLIITEPKDDRGEKMESDEEEDLDDLLTALEGGSEKKRRKRLRDEAKHSEGEPAMKYKAGGRGIHRPLERSKADFGSEYKAKKAGGDIKKAGKHDPYAYVPLNFANLNKRKQAKLKGQFAGLVKGARKGVLKARKGKTKKK